MTQDRQRQQAQPTPPTTGDDAPDLAPDLGPGTITVTPDELAAIVREQVAAATADLRRGLRPTRAAQAEVPTNAHPAPTEPTYEPPFIPGPEDWAEFNEAVKAGRAADEPIALEGTILTVAPDGSELECTPKAFRTIYAARGYVAHADDARQGLAGQSRGKGRRRRGGGNVVGEAPEQTPAQRRRRRRDDG